MVEIDVTRLSVDVVDLWMNRWLLLTAGTYDADVLTAGNTVTVPFRVIATGPAANAIAVSPITLVTAAFNSDVNANTVSTTTFLVWGLQTGLYTGTYNFPIEDQVVLMPAHALNSARRSSSWSVRASTTISGHLLSPISGSFRLP